MSDKDNVVDLAARQARERLGNMLPSGASEIDAPEIGGYVAHGFTTTGATAEDSETAAAMLSDTREVLSGLIGDFEALREAVSQMTVNYAIARRNIALKHNTVVHMQVLVEHVSEPMAWEDYIHSVVGRPELLLSGIDGVTFTYCEVSPELKDKLDAAEHTGDVVPFPTKH